MSGKKNLFLSLSIVSFGFIVLLLSLLAVTPVYAEPLEQEIDNGNCIKCHEDLYFLHDTGHYFCIRESPMRCVDCHGGNLEATTQETAHFDRSAHPVINGDISKCQECHVNEGECSEHVSKFEQVAGIKHVKLVSPVPASNIPNQTTGESAFEKDEPFSKLLALEVLPLFVITSLALMIYVLHKVRHP